MHDAPRGPVKSPETRDPHARGHALREFTRLREEETRLRDGLRRFPTRFVASRVVWSAVALGSAGLLWLLLPGGLLEVDGVQIAAGSLACFVPLALVVAHGLRLRRVRSRRWQLLSELGPEDAARLLPTMIDARR